MNGPSAPNPPSMAAMFSLRRSHRNEAWDGVVVGKKRGMTDGSTRLLRAHRDLWKSVEEGDFLVKAAGAEPVKR